MAGTLSGDSGWKNFGPSSSFALRVTWSGSQNIAGNYTDVTTTLQLRSNNSYSYFDYTSNIGLSINGTSYDDINRRIVLNPNQTITLKSQNVRVSHDSAGRKGYTVYFNFSNPVTGNSGTFSLGVSLKDIPRAYTFIYNSNNITMDSAQTILINDNGSGFTAKLFCDFGNKRVTINGNAPKGSNITTVMPSSTYADQIPNATSGVGNIVVETWNGGDKIGTNSAPITLNLPSNVVPSISSITYNDQTSAIKNLTGNDQILVSGYSVPRMNVQASGIYGSSISSYKFEVGGITVTNNGYLTDISLRDNNVGTGSVTVKVTVTDSRGRTATGTDTLDIRPYSLPTMTNFSAVRVKAQDGTMTSINVTKSVSVSSIKNGTLEKNTYTVVTQTKKATDTAWNEVKREVNTSGNFELTGYSIADSYDVRVIISDTLNTSSPVIVQETVSTDTVLIDFYKDIGVGIGKYYEEGHGSLDVGDDIHLNGNVVQNGSIWSGSLPAGDTTTKEYWFTFPEGRSAWWYGNDSNVKNTPSSWGFVEVTKGGGSRPDFSVLWYTQASGTIYRTSGNANSISGWNSLIQSIQPYYMFNTTRAVAKPWGDIAFPWQNTIVQGSSLSVNSTDNTKINVNESGWYEFYISGTITGATAGRWYDLGIMSAYDNSGTKYDGQNWVQQYTKRGHYYPPNNKEFVIAQTFTVKLEKGYCLVGSNGDDSTGTISNIWCTFKRIADKNW